MDTTAEIVQHEGVTVVRDSRGELVARKVVPAADRGRLRHELAVLGRLHGLAVVSPRQPGTAAATGTAARTETGAVDPDSGEADGQVDFIYVGPRTLAEATDLAPARLLAMLAAVARTLEEAHERGVSHGRVDGSHVLLGSQDQPVLCGWAEAGIDPAVLAEPGGGTDVAGTGFPGTDVPGTGYLVTGFLGAVGSAPVPPFDPAGDVAALGELAFQVAQRNRSVSGRIRTQLTAVATAARHPDPKLRPPMTELARVLGLSGPASEPVQQPLSPAGSNPPRWERPSRRLVAGGGAALAAALLTVVAVGSFTGSAPRSTAAGGAASPATEDAASPLPVDPGATVEPGSPAGSGSGSDAGSAPGSVPGSTPAPTAARGSPSATASPLIDKPCPTTAEELALAGLATRCLVPLAVSLNGHQLHIAQLVFTLGQPGDVAALSDPGCTGKLTPTVLQPASGAVFVYDEWAGAERPSTARSLDVVVGAVGFADPTGATCGVISLRHADGTIATIATIATVGSGGGR